jgi:hypothetical protein
MRFWAWFWHFIFPLCATSGIIGITPPGLVDFSHITRNPHTSALVAPAGRAGDPDFIAPVLDIPAAVLFARMQAVAAAEPRTYPLDLYPQNLQAAYVVRSHYANFPDVVELAVVPLGPDKSTYFFYSHASYWGYAYGVNRARAKHWANALQEEQGETK